MKRIEFDKSGKYFTAKDYDRIEPFTEGLAPVMKKDKWGYIDEKLKLQIPYTYQSAREFNDCVAPVFKNNKIGFINKSGKVVVDFLFDEADDFAHFKNGLCVVMLEEQMGLVDLSGKLIVPCEIDIITEFRENVFKFEKKSKIAYFNSLSRTYIWKEEGY